MSQAISRDQGEFVVEPLLLVAVDANVVVPAIRDVTEADRPALKQLIAMTVNREHSLKTWPKALFTGGPEPYRGVHLSREARGQSRSPDLMAKWRAEQAA